MRIAIAGGDARFAHLAALLRARGHDVRLNPAAQDLAEADGIVAQNPVKGSQLDMAAILAHMRPDARLWLLGSSRCGIPAGVRCADLLEDEAFARANAQLTAEGAVCAAMSATEGALCRSRCLIVGYGRIGQALTRMLLGLGAQVTVAARRSEMRRAAEQAGARACDCSESALAEALARSEFAFSTPPSPLLTEPVLRHAAPGVQIIDLASPPYGVDLAAAQSLGIRAWRESGLPGRYCPLAAAQGMAEKLEAWMSGEGNGEVCP